jgi:hypothetical protein
MKIMNQPYVGTRYTVSALPPSQRTCCSMFLRSGKIYFSSLLWGLVALIAACVPHIPATIPPQLQHTPGAFVVVDERTYDAGVFRVVYPSGWRIVKSSVASAPMEVIFVSPDDAMTLQVYAADCPTAEETPDPAWIDLYRTAARACLYGHAPAEREAEFMPIFEQVAASIR